MVSPKSVSHLPKCVSVFCLGPPVIHPEPGVERLSGFSLETTYTCSEAEPLTEMVRFGGTPSTTLTYVVLSHCHMGRTPSDVLVKIGFRHCGRVIDYLCATYSTYHWECDECCCRKY